MSPNLHSAIKSQVSALLLRRRRAAFSAWTWTAGTTRTPSYARTRRHCSPGTASTRVRSCSTPCLSPVSKDFEHKDCSGLKKRHHQLEIVLCGSSKLLSHGHMPTWSLLLVATTVIQGARCSFLRNSLFQIWQLGHGDYSASRTKVFRMVNTLGVNNEAKQTIQVLQAELNETKERLHTVEELKGQTAHYLYCS
uniref:Uncharacterized protein n=1 Tax=Zea mays TaxID=4577 RepID=A0A804QT26_MAIZE